MALFACRVRSHMVTGYSPFYLVYGIHPRIPGDHVYPDVVQQWLKEEDAMYSINNRLTALTDLNKSRENAKESCLESKQYSRNRHEKIFGKNYISFKVGDRVYLFNETRRKFQLNWFGPYVITRKFNNGTYQLMDKDQKTLNGFYHQIRLKLAKFFTKEEQTRLFESKKGRMLENTIPNKERVPFVIPKPRAIQDLRKESLAIGPW